MHNLRIDRVGKRYGAVVALHPTSLTVEAGEFLTLLGPSGSGKTTLLSLIAGLIDLDEGQIDYAGRDISHEPSHRRGLGMVFQNYALFPHMTVAENVAFGLQARRLPAADIVAKVERALATVRLTPYADRLPAQLSGGQQQRVALARAIAYEPQLILMDEPLGALDRALRDEMKEEIARLHRQLRASIVYVTHDQEEALVLSDRICLMNQGAIVQLAAPDAMYFQPNCRFAAEFLGESNLLPCRVASGTVTLPELGLNLPLPAAQDGPGLLLIRPESIEIVDRSDAFTIAATVTERIFIGAMTRLTVAVAGVPLKLLQVTRSRDWLRHADPGAELLLRIAPDHCHFLAEATT